MKHQISYIAIFSLFYISAFAQISWEPTNGPEGGYVGDIQSNSKYCFYLGDLKIFRTGDGVSWEAVSEENITFLYVFGDTLLAQVNTGTFFNPSNEHLLKYSLDQGETWIRANKPTLASYYYQATISKHGIYVYDLENRGLYRSQDLGNNWTLISSIEFVSEIKSFGDFVYFESGNNIYKSNSDGLEFKIISPQQGEDIIYFFAKEDKVYFSTDNAFWYSEDEGRTWNSHSYPWPDRIYKIQGIGNRIYLVGGPTELAYSDDFGKNITNLTVPSWRFYVFRIAAFKNNILTSNPQSGVTKLDTSNHKWSIFNNGLNSAYSTELKAKGDSVWSITGTGLSVLNLKSKQWKTLQNREEINDFIAHLALEIKVKCITGKNSIATFIFPTTMA